MKLKTKLMLILILVFLTSFSALEYVRYLSIKNEVLGDLRSEARNIRSVLMATRRVYHHQFLDSGIPLTDKTLGFLPAHALGRISVDFRNWTTSELYFNNVSDRPRNPKNAADLVEKEAINYFRKNPDEKERFVAFESEERNSFYHFSAPIWIEEYCLKCHGKREDAPAAIRTNYASAFNYEIGDLRGIMSIKLPSSHLNSIIWTNFKSDLWIHLSSFSVMFLLISWLLNRYVNKPLNKLVVGLESVASGSLDHSIAGLSGEMAIVGRSFDNMSKELRQRDNELKESEMKFLLLLNSTGEAIYGLDLEGNCTFCNPSCLSLLGYEHESQLLGRNMHALIHHTRKDGTPYPEEECCIYQAFREGKGTHVDDEVLWRADGTSFAAEYRSFPIFQEGKTVGSVVSFVDITERKKSEIRLGAQHAVTQVLAEATTLNEASLKILQIICTALEWDLGEIWAYDQQSCMLKCSEIWHIPSVEVSEFEKITKQTTFSPGIGLPGRVISRAQPVWIADVVHDTNFPRASVAAKEGLHGAFGFPILIGRDVLGTICFFSREIREPDKDLLDMMTAIGSQIGLFIRRRQAEEALLQSEKLKSIGTITAGVAHEFNNLLAIISGKVQLLEGSHKEDKELAETLLTIKRATNDGAEISRRMLKFTKTDKDTAGFVPIDINELINQVIDFTTPRWKNMAQAKGINYHMDTEGMKGIPKVLCNPTELREVFVNIINNALDAMPDDGRITFRTWSEDGTVFISISDTGEGIPEEVKKDIFDPFFTTRSPVGTGLGLSTAYGIIARHGGNIEVESEVGKGTTFNLQFPIATKADSPKESPETKQEIMNKCLRILVVDDNEEICNILNELFSSDGHDVKAVTSGKEGIDLIKSEEFDLVLSDLVMPGLSGHDVIQALDELDKRPKVGLITGWDEKIETKDTEEFKVDFIIKKPFDHSDLIKQINDVFNK